jgi:aminoglycoside 6'-N-acetyltransferase I
MILPRPATPSLSIQPLQSPALFHECARLLMAAYNAEPWNDAWTEGKAYEKLMCFFNSPHFFGLVAQEGDTVRGCCVGNVEPYYTGDYFYLKEMFVAPDAQRQGIGARLMAALKAHLDAIDIRTIILFTSQQTFPFDFYRKEDFQLMEGMCMMHFEK